MPRLLLALVLVLLLSCVRNPATGRRELSLVSRAQEVVGVAPGQDAAMVLGLAPTGPPTPEAAVQLFERSVFPPWCPWKRPLA